MYSGGIQSHLNHRIFIVEYNQMDNPIPLFELLGVLKMHPNAFLRPSNRRDVRRPLRVTDPKPCNRCDVRRPLRVTDPRASYSED
jgi:hypothetical protein